MTNQEQAVIILEARKLLVRGWTKHIYARNAEGHGVHFSSMYGVEFCAYGSLYHVIGLDILPEAYQNIFDLLNIKSQSLYEAGLVVLNDTSRTSEPVLKVFDAVIHDLLGDKP